MKPWEGTLPGEGTSVGFTSSRQGMTARQHRRVAMLLRDLRPAKVHHGDAEGADADFDALARALSPRPWIEVHPPIGRLPRAHCDGDVIHDPLPPVDRNKAIVSDSRIVIATPRVAREERRDGTWMVLRYARAQGRFLYIVGPDGCLVQWE